MHSYRCFSFIVKLAYQFSLIILSIILWTLCVVIVPLILIWRYFVIICAKLFRPQLIGIVSGLDLIFGQHFENWHTNPKEIIIMNSVIEESEDFLENTITFFETLLQDPNYQRLRQYFAPFMGYAFWKEDSQFDLKYHIKNHDECKSLQSPVDENWIKQLKKSKLQAPFGKNKSPWEIIFIPNYKYQSSNIKYSYAIWRFHHSLGDGLSYRELQYKMSKNFIVANDSEIERKKINLISKVVKMLIVVTKAPYDIIKSFIEVNDRDKTPWCTKPSQFTGVNNYGKCKPIPVENLKAIRHKFKVSMVSVILHCITNIVISAMKMKGIKIPDVIYANIPLPLPNHPKDRLCNNMTFALFPLPVGVSDSVERLRCIESHYKNLKSSTEPISAILLLNLMACFPLSIVHKLEQFVTVMATIVPLSSDFQDAFGCRHVEKNVSVSVPATMLHSGFFVSSLTYCGFVSLEACVDSSIIQTDEMLQEVMDGLYKDILTAEETAISTKTVDNDPHVTLNIAASYSEEKHEYVTHL